MSDDKLINEYETNTEKIQVIDRPIKFVKNSFIDSETIFYQKQLGVNYSRVEVQLQKGSITIETGTFTSSMGDIRFERLNLGVGSMVSGMLNRSRGDEFFKQQLSGTGKIWLKDTTSYLIVIPLRGETITLEKGLFYAGVGKLKYSVSSDVRASNIVWSGGRNLFNTTISGTGYVILESPVHQEDLIRLEVSQRVSAMVDDELVLYRFGNIKRSSQLSGGVLTSMLNKEGVVDEYRGQGYICVAPTLNSQTYLGENIHNHLTKDTDKDRPN